MPITNTVSLLQSPLGVSKKHKTEGNSHFREGRYDEAITCYNEAIAACPRQSAYDLSTFYQNRAAAYEQMVRIILHCSLQGDYC